MSNIVALHFKDKYRLLMLLQKVTGITVNMIEDVPDCQDLLDRFHGGLLERA